MWVANDGKERKGCNSTCCLSNQGGDSGPLGDTRAETPADSLAVMSVDTDMGQMFPRYFGQNTCLPGVAETPDTWVIPGRDSAPTKMATHLDDSRSEAESLACP